MNASDSPQKENGYTAVANEIMEVLAGTKLNGTQFRIVLTVLRFTYGFNRKEHQFSEKFLAEATGMHIQQIKRELGQLIEMQIIKIAKLATFSTPRELSFNKHHQEWKLGKQNSDQIAIEIPGSELDTTSGSELDTPPNDNENSVEASNGNGSDGVTEALGGGSELATQERHDKDNIKDNIIILSSQVESGAKKGGKRTTLFDVDSDEYKLALLLRNRILDNLPTAKAPPANSNGLAKWSEEMDRLIRIDKRSPEEVIQMIEWSQTNSFWRSVILSVKKLRDKWDTMAAQRKEREARAKNGYAAKHTQSNSVQDFSEYDNAI